MWTCDTCRAGHVAAHQEMLYSSNEEQWSALLEGLPQGLLDTVANMQRRRPPGKLSDACLHAVCQIHSLLGLCVWCHSCVATCAMCKQYNCIALLMES